MKDSDHRKQVIAGLAVLVIIAVIVVATLSASKKNPADSLTSADTSPTTEPVVELTVAPTTVVNAAPTAVPKSGAPTQAYRDGSYTATGTYSSPGGNEAIAVTVTLKNGIISDTSAQPKANDSDSAEYQAKFISGYKSLVVGKSIDTVSLSRVSGSSLTSKGFNSAISTIKTQAKT